MELPGQSKLFTSPYSYRAPHWICVSETHACLAALLANQCELLNVNNDAGKLADNYYSGNSSASSGTIIDQGIPSSVRSSGKVLVFYMPIGDRLSLMKYLITTTHTASTLLTCSDRPRSEGCSTRQRIMNVRDTAGRPTNA